MKAQDLRINNYLDFEGKPHKVSAIHGDNTIRFLVPYGGSIGCFSIKNPDIKPIPLNEEWLLKFGFVKSTHWFELENTSISLNLNQYILEFNDAYQESKMPVYVHQLQNLYYALTNKELTIKELVK